MKIKSNYNFNEKKQQKSKKKCQNAAKQFLSQFSANINVNVVNNLNNHYQMVNKVDRDTSTFLKNNHRNYPVLKEINKNSQRHPNRRRWAPYVIGFFILLYYISASAYRLLQNNLPIPAESTIHLHAQKFFSDNSYSIVDLNDLPSLLNSFRNHINESNFSYIEGIIAVDAESLYSNHKIENNTISGFINLDNLTIENTDEVRHSFSKFENFISNRSNKTIKSAFVFQFHPINIKYPVFLVHLYPWISGKANDIIKQRMFTLRKLMNKNFFKIIGYSFDGDSSYRHNLEN